MGVGVGLSGLGFRCLVAIVCWICKLLLAGGFVIAVLGWVVCFDWWFRVFVWVLGFFSLVDCAGCL